MLLWGSFSSAAWTVMVKPLLISRGSSLPFLLVLLGVMGECLPSVSSNFHRRIARDQPGAVDIACAGMTSFVPTDYVIVCRPPL